MKLEEQGHPCWLIDVEVAGRNQPPVGRDWAGVFIRRRPKLAIKLNWECDRRVRRLPCA